MTRKHYIQAAEIIKYRLGRAQSPDEVSGIQGIAEDLAHMFAADNSRFDRQKFMAAAGF